MIASGLRHTLRLLGSIRVASAQSANQLENSSAMSSGLSAPTGLAGAGGR
ncbi:hypothetical protein [Kitasatospora griseola]